MHALLLLSIAAILSAGEAVYVTAFRDPCTALEVHRLAGLGDPVARLDVLGRDGDSRAMHADGMAIALPGTDRVVHRYPLSGLVPGASYRLVVPAGGGSIDLGTVRTVPSDGARPLRIATGGDTMHRPEWLAGTAKVLAARDPDLVVIGGDLAYEDGKNGPRVVTWIRTWSEAARAPDGRLLPFISCIGNHEVRGGYGKTPAEAPYYFAMMPLDGVAYRAVDVGPGLSFILLDTDHATRLPGAQTDWLAQALAARTARATVIPVYHYPAWPVVKVPAGGADPSDEPLARQIRALWVPLFERAHVRLVLEHDQHAYKRTHPLLAGKQDPAGITYLGDGAWGVETRKPFPGITYAAKVDDRRHGYLLTIAADGRVGVEAIDEAGEVFDRAEIPAGH